MWSLDGVEAEGVADAVHSLFAVVGFSALLLTVGSEVMAREWLPSSLHRRLRSSLILLFANPFASAPHFNLGVQGFRYQMLNLVLHHKRDSNKASHSVTLPLDGVAHFVLAHAALRWFSEDRRLLAMGSALILTALLLQAKTFHNRVLFLTLALVFLTMEAAVWLYLIPHFSSPASFARLLLWCEAWLLLSPLPRCLTHMVDHIPPYMAVFSFSWPCWSPPSSKAKNPHGFHFVWDLPIARPDVLFPFRCVSWLLRMTVAGYVAEFQAGAVWRLFPVQVYYLLTLSAPVSYWTAGWEGELGSLREYQAESATIAEHGFHHSPLTRDIYTWQDRPRKPSRADFIRTASGRLLIDSAPMTPVLTLGKAGRNASTPSSQES